MIRKISFDSTDMGGQQRRFIYTVGQRVTIGDNSGVISSFEYIKKSKELTVYVDCGSLNFPWFTLVNGNNLKIEWEYEFFTNEDPNECVDEG